jgi:hypothetical protein
MSDQMPSGQKEKIIGKINKMKSNVERVMSEVNVGELKDSLNNMVKDVQKDFSKLVDKDLGNLKSKLHKEKALLEKKAKKFLDNHKKEINALQVKFEKLMKASGKKQPTKTATPAAKKKVIAKPVTAKAIKKTTTKKVAVKKKR